MHTSCSPTLLPIPFAACFPVASASILLVSFLHDRCTFCSCEAPLTHEAEEGQEGEGKGDRLLPSPQALRGSQWSTGAGQLSLPGCPPASRPARSVGRSVGLSVTRLVCFLAWFRSCLFFGPFACSGLAEPRRAEDDEGERRWSARGVLKGQLHPVRRSPKSLLSKASLLACSYISPHSRFFVFPLLVAVLFAVLPVVVVVVVVVVVDVSRVLVLVVELTPPRSSSPAGATGEPGNAAIKNLKYFPWTASYSSVAWRSRRLGVRALGSISACHVS